MLDNIVHFSIRHKWLVLVSAVLSAVWGVVSLAGMPLDALPDVTSVQVEVVSTAPGKSPLEIEKNVTYHIEAALRGIPQMTQLRSVSKYGISVVTAVFKDGTDIYFAREQVLERLSEVRGELGPGITTSMGPVATAMGEIYQYTLETEDKNPSVETLTELRTLQDWVVAPLLKNVEGVSEVNSFGGYIKEYQIVAQASAMAQYGVDLNALYAAVERNNANVGGGILETEGEQYFIRGLGQVKSAGEIGNIVVLARKGVPVLLKDVAKVKIGYAVRQGASFENGEKEVVGGVVMMLRGANGRVVTKAVEEKVKEINESRVLPQGVRLKAYYTRSDIILGSVKTMARALGEGSVIVIIVLYVFLLSFQGSFVTLAALPLALLLTFIIMKHFGLTANLMSLGGLAISLGMIIDSTIIQVENVLHHLNSNTDGVKERGAAVAAAILEVRKPSIFGEMIIALSFVPILALQGIEGKMFKPLAVTVMIALFSSLVLSLTVIPALCVLVLRPAKDEESPLMRLAKRLYLPVLNWSVGNRAKVLLCCGGLLAFSLFLYPRLGTEFVPVMDEGAFDMDIAIFPGASLSASSDIARKIEAKLKTFPELETVISKTGWTGKAVEARGVEKTGMVGKLKPKSEWTSAATRDELFEKMRRAVDVIPGIVFGFSQPIQCRIDEMVSGARSQLAIRLYGDDLDLLQKKGGEIAAVLSGVKGSADVALEQQGGQSYINIAVNREKISRYGFNVADVCGAIEIALGGKPAGVFFEGERTFDITVRIPEEERASVSALENFMLTSPATGARVPLSGLADIKTEEGPAQISRESGKRRILVETNVSGRDLGGFVAEVQKKISRKVKIPYGYYLTWGGQFENQQKAMRKLAVIMPLTIVMIFLLLAVTFNSVNQAVIVLLNLPLALVGGIIALYVSGQYLSVPAAVGFIVLLGVAVLNGMVLLTYISQLRVKRYTCAAAVATGCERRLRPVLLTALITVSSLVPMLFATGPGSEVQRPLATVVVGGLISSTLLTLVVLPVIYGWFCKEHKES
ncbi:MAG: CusA/CzcA family heavy metal efflux RND transporter [Elusimicrobiaceae bacterium]